ARWYLQRFFAVKGQRLNLRAHRRIGEAHRQLEEDVAGLALEELVRLDIERDEQVARRAATRGRLALARHPDRDTVVYPGGNVNRHAAHIAHAPLAVAALARRGDDASLATTAVADHHVDELAKDRLLHPANLARSLAVWAARRIRAGLRAIATAVGAGLPAWNIDLFLAAMDGVIEGDRQLIFQVSATLRRATSCTRGGIGKELLEQ